jgi:putative FmdB family regulatory protein
MPNYDFECKSCKIEFVAFYPMDTNTPVECPYCNKKDSFKIFRHAPAVLNSNPPGSARYMRGQCRR